MAQLRDTQTSAVVFDGPVEEVVRLAQDIPQNNVMFDGVGPYFDPQIVLASLEQPDNTAKGKKARSDKSEVVTKRVQEARARLELED